MDVIISTWSADVTVAARRLLHGKAGQVTVIMSSIETVAILPPIHHESYVTAWVRDRLSSAGQRARALCRQRLGAATEVYYELQWTLPVMLVSMASMFLSGTIKSGQTQP